MSTGLEITAAEATVEGNTVVGLMSHGVGIQITEAQVVLSQNRLSQNGIGMKISGAVARLIENEIYANKIGIQLTPHKGADAHVELVKNKINHNEECGVAAQSYRYEAGRRCMRYSKGSLEVKRTRLKAISEMISVPPTIPGRQGFGGNRLACSAQARVENISDRVA